MLPYGVARVTDGELTVYAEGLLFASVCSSLPLAEVEREMARRLCGTTSGWTLHDGPFKDGTENGVQCNTDPERRHWLFEA